MEVKYPITILISDTHLGATGSRYRKFNEFLKSNLEKIKNDPKFKENLKSFIILGDIFDLVCDSCRDIKKDHITIFNQLNELIDYGISVISILGNHDISVSGNYDKKFVKEKKKLIRKFKKLKFDAKFLNELSISQYLLLKNINAKWYLHLYDTQNIYNTDPIRTIELGNVISLDKDYNILLTHGHQFFPVKTQGASSIWDFCLNAPDFIKEIFNYLWNIIISGIKPNKNSEFEELIIKNKEDIHRKFNLKLTKQKIKKVVKFYDDMINGDHLRDTLKNANIVIPDILETSRLTHILFGHTHKVEIYNKDDILIINTGAWHHTRPCYVEFFANGEFKVNVMNDNGEWEDYKIN
ncbi:MAG: metallophosphoesterase [Candidatus Helarchaeota archaeon]